MGAQHGNTVGRSNVTIIGDYDELDEENIAPRRQVTFPRPAPAALPSNIALNRYVLEPGETIAYYCRPQRPFKVQALVAIEASADIVIKHIRVGCIELSSGLASPIFSPDSKYHEKYSETASPGVQIMLEIENIGDVPRAFSGAFTGLCPGGGSVESSVNANRIHLNPNPPIKRITAAEYGIAKQLQDPQPIKGKLIHPDHCAPDNVGPRDHRAVIQDDKKEEWEAWASPSWEEP